jgi:tRNA threonylcarbamoyladenosine biosynthesis protein TsaE
MMRWRVPDREAMLALGARMAACLKSGDVLLLEGELGAGKTTLAQGILAALAEEKTTIASPTFTMLHTYPILLADGARGECWHYDLYRVTHTGELVELALDDAWNQALVLIEWPDRLPAPPPGAIRLALRFAETGEGREVECVVPPEKQPYWSSCDATPA